ncbi:ABC transporter ATP-binding protein [Magnetospirillum fulvum]|uniref:Iron complex transport system ATP-binding protein n=1 Tax=Magnetospirillum fulvum TaxID=1082 RepID=A0A1H6J8T9_MAGFU|nr:ABC transporter ATP-binding protein [Magnetospirillum fulvum]SEH58443.1 iron complex transport system ATP-binding protein [Magnetospirillum fulvum]
MKTAAPLLQGKDVWFHRNGRAVLQGADLGLGPGELVSLLGANGAGKTTLLRLLLGFERPKAGEVRLGQAALRDLSRRAIARAVAYVPQSHVAPFPYRVREVIGLGRLAVTGLFRAPGPADRDAVAATMARLGIAHLADRPYTEISGGERQLALIGRALAQEAGLLVMDEPLTGLDYGNQLRLLDRLAELAESGLGILMTTHAPDLAAMVSTRVAVLINGRIAADGPPETVVTDAMIERLYGVTPRRTPKRVFARPRP